MSQTTPSNKRRSESSHRSQTLERLGTHGIFMESSNLMQKSSRRLCHDLLKGHRKVVKTLIFTQKEFSTVLDRVKNLNEARIQRDVTPLIVPSAETLRIRGELTIDYIGEELDAEWVRCATMGSTRPKPDYTAGLQRCAFTEEEILKLENYASPVRPFYFTPNLTFPFLICEAKTGEKGMNEADRQNIHSASIAVRAIIALYRAAYGQTEPDRVEKLYGQVLLFTVSHDNDRVFLYGHFAVYHPAMPDGLKFGRYPINLFSLTANDGLDRLKAYNFVYNVYAKFTPQHLKRIQLAVAQLPVPKPKTGLSFAASDLSLTQSGSQNDSQDGLADNSFVKPDPPSDASQQAQVALLREELQAQRLQMAQQLQQQRQDSREQMAQQKQQMEQQMAQQKQQMEQQMAQQKQHMEQQMAQQQQQMEQQLQQQKEIITLLKARSPP